MDGENTIQLDSVMDSLERKILAAFNGPRAPCRTLAEIDGTSAAKEAVSRLVERGLLRTTADPEGFVRTEQGRLQLAAARDITIYSRPGCHLCEEAKHQIEPLLREFGARMTEINIDEDAELRAQYDYDVPVIFLGARKVGKHRLDLAQFRRQLKDATRE
jgi:glutaredoxin